MKKFLLSIFALMLAVFSVQAEEVTLDQSAVSGMGKSGGGSGFVKEVSPITFDFSNAYGASGHIKAYGKCELAISGATITKVVINANNGYIKTWSANDGNVSVSGNVATWTGTSTSLVLTNTATAQARITSVVVTYTTTGGEGGGETDVETVVTPTFNPADGATFEESLPVTISSATEGATIHYTLNGGTEQTGVSPVTVTVTETTEIVAFATKTSCTDSDKATATYTKVVPVDPNAKEVEATISFATTAQRLSQDSNSQVWANGGVTFTNNKSASQNAVVSNTNPVRLYANSELVIECAGNIKKIVFDCNSPSYATALKNSIGAAATVSSDIVTLTLDGTSSIYTVAKLTAQVRMDKMTVTYLVSGEQAEKPAAPTFSVETGSKFYPTLELEISAAEGAVIYYTLNGGNPTTESAVYSTPITIEETTVVKAIAVIDGVESDVAAASYKKVIDSVTGNVADAFYYYVGGEQIPAVITGYIVGGIANEKNSLGTNGENCVFGVEGVDDTYILIADNADETDYTKCLVVQLPSGDIRTALNLVDNPNNCKNKVVLTATLETYFGVAGLRSTSAYEFIPEYTLSVSNAGWATLYLDFNAQIPTFEGEDAGAYIVTGVKEGSWLKLVKVDGVLPANTGILVKADAKDGGYTFKYTATATANVDGNLLKGTTKKELITKDANKEYYALGLADNIVCFYNAVNGDNENEFYNNAFKAYLEVENVTGGVPSASLRFDFGGTTAIEEVETEAAETVIYDLTGRRVNEITKAGVYIVNGKKVMVK